MADLKSNPMDSARLFQALEEAAKATFETIATSFQRQVRVGSGEIQDPAQIFKQIVDGEHGQVHICAKVDFVGDVTGQVILRCNAQGALDISRGLLMLEEGEAIQIDEVEDALAECANIIGGLMKTKALDPHGTYRLGLPEIFRLPHDSEGTHGGSLLYQIKQGIISVEIWRLDGVDGSSRAAA